jgi:hypothetical protein
MKIIKKNEFMQDEGRICLTIYKDELEFYIYRELFYLIVETTMYYYPKPSHNTRYLGMSGDLGYAICDALNINDPGFVTVKYVEFFKEALGEFLQNNSHKKEIELKLEYLEKYIKLEIENLNEITKNL